MKYMTILLIPCFAVCFYGCSNHKVKTDMMDTINFEREELIVLENIFGKYNDAIDYLAEVRKSDEPTPLSAENCNTYYGIAKSNFANLADDMDTALYPTLIDLVDSTNYLIAITDLWLMTCNENKLSQDKIDLMVALYGNLLENTRKSRDTFLRNAQELVSKYNYDLEVYSSYTTQEAQNRKQFWAQFFGALAAGLATGLNNTQTSDSGTYTIMDTGKGTFNITNTQTGEVKYCNSFGNFANCF